MKSMPLVWALLPNKSAATYKEMWIAIRESLVMEFGNIGSVRYFITDFELAAIQAIHNVFPEAVIEGCRFHFRQAKLIIQRMNEEGRPNIWPHVECSEVR